MFYSQNRELCGTSREITDRSGGYVRSVHCRLPGLRAYGAVAQVNQLSALSRMEAAEQGDR